MKTAIKIIFRIIILPFFMGMLSVTFVRAFIAIIINFMRYGGEFINYDRKVNPQSIKELLSDLN